MMKWKVKGGGGGGETSRIPLPLLPNILWKITFLLGSSWIWKLQATFNFSIIFNEVDARQNSNKISLCGIKTRENLLYDVMVSIYIKRMQCKIVNENFDRENKTNLLYKRMQTKTKFLKYQYIGIKSNKKYAV